jgi:hypothetical protein
MMRAMLRIGVSLRPKRRPAFSRASRRRRGSRCLTWVEARGYRAWFAGAVFPHSKYTITSPQRQRVALSVHLLGFVVMPHSDDHIPLFVSLFDIPVSLGHLFQRIAPINDRFYLSCLNQLFEEE